MFISLRVFVGVHFRRIFVVFGSMEVMALGHFGVVRAFFVVSSFVVFCGLAMVLGRLVMMVRSLCMVLMDFVTIH